MSTALATEPYRPQRTERLRALETDAYQRPRTAGPTAPVWAERVEETIRVIVRLGCSPTPTILLVSAIAISAALRA
jgi:hypothetical protein